MAITSPGPCPASALAAPKAAPEPSPAPPTIEAASRDEARAKLKAKLTADLTSAAAKKDLPAAATALSQLCQLDPADGRMRFNLAAVLTRLSQLGSPPDEPARSMLRAVATLKEAFELGFDEFDRLNADRALAPLRADPDISLILADTEPLLRAQFDARAKRAERRFGIKQPPIVDEQLRIGVLSNLPEASVAAARQQLRTTTAWWESVAPETAPVAPAGSPWVLVVIPPRPAFNRWAAETAGSRADSLAGLYDHDARELVTQDTGSTLRHEFAHVLHWRWCMKRGQVDPMWIQEGLCSLVEDVTVTKAEDGSLTVSPKPSWRTNTLRSMAQGGNVPKLAEFLAMQPGTFVGKRTLANYATSRGLMLFLVEKGKLRGFLSELPGTFDADATGTTALERAMGTKLVDIEREFRVWAIKLPEAPDASRGMYRSLGVQLEQAPDGLAVSRMDLAEIKTGGFLPGDVVLSVDGQPIHDYNELEAVIGKKGVGEAVSVVIRRLGKEQTLRVRLQ